MKKWLPWLLGLAFLVILVLLVMSAKKPRRHMDERVTLKQKDKIPYGTYVARQFLPAMFPKARVVDDNNPPGEWNYISSDKKKQAVFLLAMNFNPDSEETDEIMKFVRQGNYVFIITRFYTYYFQNVAGINNAASYIDDTADDSLLVSLNAPRYTDSYFGYPGRKFTGHILDFDSSKAVVLGKDRKLTGNFLQLRAGEGKVFIHLAPPVFTNYFLLYKDNMRYYEKALSLIPADVSTVVWNEYYLSNKTKEKEPSWLGVLFRYESFRWALLVALFTIGLYMLFEMRRKQRYIPFYEKPKNETLDFVETIGRLYYDKNDHKDLAVKMGTYFLDHVREQYRLQTEMLNEEFITNLHWKTGYPVKNIKQIVEFIQFARTAPAISEYQLSRFHQQLETFYKNH